eukprot:1719671-Pyramimonas_sp.AAC.1
MGRFDGACRSPHVADAWAMRFDLESDPIFPTTMRRDHPTPPCLAPNVEASNAADSTAPFR